jgi:uncharacterized protein involved in type VI secretion and phage assembly
MNDATAIADGARNALWSGIIQAEGHCYGNPKIIAGSKVKISNIGTRFSGEYIVSQARHFRGEAGEYFTEFEVRGLRSESFSDLVTGGVAADGWRPDSRWAGVVTGVVSNIDDPEDLGRVKLALPWLDQRGEQFETNWARIAVPMSGSNQGVWFAPEVNDEVLVAFEHGDINRPYVVGFLWNGKAKPPSTAIEGGRVDERVIFTRAGHKLTFREKAGKEAIEIVDKKGSNKITIDSTSGAITIEGMSFNFKATNDVNIEGTNVKIKANANFSVEANATVDIKAQAQLNAQASGPASIKGAIINLN